MLTRRRFVQGSAFAAGLGLVGQNALWAATDMATMPPGLTWTAFQEALRAMRSVVGARYVFADETGLLGYHDHFAMKPIEAHMPSAAVAPRTVEEIQALLKIARDHSVPVWTISTGRNFGYGGPAPRMPGTQADEPHHRGQ